MGDMVHTLGGFFGGSSGGFSNLLGPEGMGLTGSTSSTLQRTAGDIYAQQLNAGRSAEMQSMRDQFGSLGNVMQNYTGMVNPSPQTYGLAGAGADYALNATPLNAQDWYNNALQNINPSQAQCAVRLLFKLVSF